MKVVIRRIYFMKTLKKLLLFKISTALPKDKITIFWRIEAEIKKILIVKMSRIKSSRFRQVVNKRQYRFD